MDDKDARKKYMQHRRDAGGRDIPFLLTFEEWKEIWLSSGKWLLRGRKRGQFVMSRYNDIGDYSIHNVFIQPCGDNVSQASKSRTGQVRSKESCENISKGLTGRKRSAADVAAQVIRMTGQKKTPFSEQARRNMSIAALKRKKA